MPEFKETCDYHCEVLERKPASLKCLIDGERNIFIPFSQICDSSEITEKADEGDEGIITISEWLAVQEGLE